MTGFLALLLSNRPRLVPRRAVCLAISRQISPRRRLWSSPLLFYIATRAAMDLIGRGKVERALAFAENGQTRSLSVFDACEEPGLSTLDE